MFKSWDKSHFTKSINSQQYLKSSLKSVYEKKGTCMVGTFSEFPVCYANLAQNITEMLYINYHIEVLQTVIRNESRA